LLKEVDQEHDLYSAAALKINAIGNERYPPTDKQLGFENTFEASKKH